MREFKRTAPTTTPSARRLAVFVDGANNYATLRSLRVEIDWKKFRNHFRSIGDLLHIYYYTATIDGREDNFKPTHDWMAYNGFILRTKPAKIFVDPVTKKEKIKGNLDIELTLDMYDMALAGVNDLYLFSGDGDFCPVIQKIQSFGSRVTCISTIAGDQIVCADDLRRQCDEFEDMAVAIANFGR